METDQSDLASYLAFPYGLHACLPVFPTCPPLCTTLAAFLDSNCGHLESSPWKRPDQAGSGIRYGATRQLRDAAASPAGGCLLRALCLPTVPR